MTVERLIEELKTYDQDKEVMFNYGETLMDVSKDGIIELKNCIVIG